MIKKDPPKTEAELLLRAQAIAGLSLEELAHQHQVTSPKSLVQAKGWVGQLIEHHLGADGGSSPVVDFQELGIELKTIPCDIFGNPQESTFVCAVEADFDSRQCWQTSLVRKKLSQVLWIPIVEISASTAIGERRIGSPILWNLTAAIETILRQDWEELAELLSLGRFSRINAQLGTYLQLRPKALNSRVLNPGINEEGDSIATGPKGFYLRSSFTEKIVKLYLHTALQRS